MADSKEYPSTERIEFLSELVSYKFLNKSLEVSSKSETFPLMVERRGVVPNSLNETIKLKNSLNCYPSDYDTLIIYALYKNGYPNFKLTCNFQDSGTMVTADKTFFNLNNKSNIAIYMHVTGTTITVVDYEIKIVTLNETIGKNIKNLIQEDIKKANIVLINEDPVKILPFNCSLTKRH